MIFPAMEGKFLGLVSTGGRSGVTLTLTGGVVSSFLLGVKGCG